MSIANDFAVEISNRMAAVSITNGFDTDIGLRVFRGRRRLDENQLPCAVLIERPDAATKQSLGKVKVTRKYVLEGHAACEPDNPNDAGHKIISDLKRAIFTGNITIDGRLTANGQKAFLLEYEGSSIAPREDGISVVSANIEVSIEFVEDLSNP